MDTRNSEEIGAYVNLGKFLQCRGFELDKEPLRPRHVDAASLKDGLTPSEVVKNGLIQLGEWEMIAKRPNAKGKGQDIMAIILLAPGGKFARVSQEFSRLLQSVAKKASEGKGVDAQMEMIVLASEEVQGKKNLQAEIRSLNEQSFQGGKYFMYPYHIFSFVVPEVPIVPKHEILPRKSVKAFMEMFHLESKDIGRISPRDPPVVWIGARPGDYVVVWRLSETAVTRFPHIRYVS